MNGGSQMTKEVVLPEDTVRELSETLVALELPDTPVRFRPHVHRAIALSHALLHRCQGLGGCYEAAYSGIVGMDEARLLNAHLHSDFGEEDHLHAEDCQSLAAALVSMAKPSLGKLMAHLDNEGYLYPHHIDDEPLEGDPWEAYEPLGWIDQRTFAALEGVSLEP